MLRLIPILPSAFATRTNPSEVPPEPQSREQEGPAASTGPLSYLMHASKFLGTGIASGALTFFLESAALKVLKIPSLKTQGLKHLFESFSGSQLTQRAGLRFGNNLLNSALISLALGGLSESSGTQVFGIALDLCFTQFAEKGLQPVLRALPQPLRFMLNTVLSAALFTGATTFRTYLFDRTGLERKDYREVFTRTRFAENLLFCGMAHTVGAGLGKVLERVQSTSSSSHTLTQSPSNGPTDLNSSAHGLFGQLRWQLTQGRIDLESRTPEVENLGQNIKAGVLSAIDGFSLFGTKVLTFSALADAMEAGHAGGRKVLEEIRVGEEGGSIRMAGDSTGPNFYSSNANPNTALQGIRTALEEVLQNRSGIEPAAKTAEIDSICQKLSHLAPEIITEFSSLFQNNRDFAIQLFYNVGILEETSLLLKTSAQEIPNPHLDNIQARHLFDKMIGALNDLNEPPLTPEQRTQVDQTLRGANIAPELYNYLMEGDLNPRVFLFVLHRLGLQNIFIPLQG